MVFNVLISLWSWPPAAPSPLFPPAPTHLLTPFSFWPLLLQEFGDSARARKLYIDDDDDDEEEELEPNPKLGAGGLWGLKIVDQ